MKSKKIIKALLIVVIVISLIIFNAIKIAPHKLTIRLEEIQTNKIDDSLNELTIAYFSDLHYGYITSADDVAKLVDTINNLYPDIVIFGGDLISCDYLKALSAEEKNNLINSLSLIQATYLKIAVYGDEDDLNDSSIELTNNILNNSGFSILSNSNIKFSNGSDSYINIVGTFSYLNGGLNIDETNTLLDEQAFNLVLSHCPDVYSKLDTNLSDLVLSGHSFGSKVYIPLINYFYRYDGAKKYFRGKYHKNNSMLDVTNGVGLQNKSIRLFSDAEVVLYKIVCD